MERSDVKRELRAQIVKDCENVKDYPFSDDDVHLLTKRADILSIEVRILVSCFYVKQPEHCFTKAKLM